eukprot:TRINITY_DN27276_c0_g1_i1.p1 TRINITY_DN27276_c0_g1~~TRINITY_DN27276_c0_g1_i1.p1  ORF type:complete len:124 (-),score=9.33 TRINITY_DN27276_c0_g1_i1:49-420(-)
MVWRRRPRGLLRLQIYEGRLLAGRHGRSTSRAVSSSTHEVTLRTLLRSCASQMRDATPTHEALVQRLAQALQASGSIQAEASTCTEGADVVRRLERALRRCTDCRRGRVRVLRLRGPEDLATV